ncbi:MAG TPA: hypothetical protein PKI83_03055 [Bacteroidales bacterium]|nr:hypothetical protein [Bacteroidales bacterium]
MPTSIAGILVTNTVSATISLLHPNKEIFIAGIVLEYVPVEGKVKSL